MKVYLLTDMYLWKQRLQNFGKILKMCSYVHVHCNFGQPEAANKAKILGNQIPQALKTKISKVNTFL